ncbi:MAG: 4-hydroxybenzoate octaprenyltransferase [Gammaproteobacteria bacterium]
MIIPFIHYLQLMRFDKPIGIVLLFWPVCWALLSAYHNHPPLSIMVVFTIGVVLTRAAGCIINDLCDRSIDGHVARTRARPLANGSVSVKEAYILLAVLCLGLLSLLFFINPMNRMIAFIAAALTVFYPLTKRFFAFPQLVLGITFNIGVIMVFVQADALSLQAWLMYGAAVIWTFAYDTVYALADKTDDARLGMRSSALSLGKYVDLTVCASYGAMFILLGFALSTPVIGAIIAAFFAWIYFGLGKYSLNVWSKNAPIAFFKGNAILGALIAVAITSIV